MIKTGTNGDDRLKSFTDIDTLIGGLGNDIYFVDQAEDQVVEAPGGGTDTVYASASYQLGAGEEIEYLRAFAAIGLELTGNEFDNEIIGGVGNDTLEGEGGNDTLKGGAGPDTMIGGSGDDIYYVDDTLDLVVEAAGGGVDVLYSSVNFNLAAGQEVETLWVYGSTGRTLGGNDLDNQLFGSVGDDELNGGTGNDLLNGRDGDDTITTNGASAIIYGGNGNDTIRLDGSSTSTGRVNGGDGNDTVSSADLGQFVISHVETLDTYYGFVSGSVAQFASFAAYTADQAAPDTRISISLRDAGGTLDFTTGVGGQNSVEVRDIGLTSRISITGSVNDDVLFGSGFNDTLRGGDGDDVLLAGSGRDTLQGGNGADRLNGGADTDQLAGGAGNDTFVFDSPYGGNTNRDVIADFVSGTDTIEIDQTNYFIGLSLGELDPAQFAIGAATGAGPQIVYRPTTGALFFDSNGAGAGGASQFATLTGAPVLVASDFLIV